MSAGTKSVNILILIKKSKSNSKKFFKLLRLSQRDQGSSNHK